MRCPHLKREKATACIALEREYMPSTFELREYCEKKGHKKCPFYLGFAERFLSEAFLEMIKS